MKKLFKNFSSPVMFINMIIYGSLVIVFDWLMERFKEPNLILHKLVIGYILQIVLFGFIMNLIFGKRILEKYNKQNEY